MKNSLFAVCATTMLLGTTSLPSLSAENDLNLLGDPAPPTAADHTIVITPNTHYVNVTGGDVVKFVIHGKPFTWNFDTASTISEFDLKQITPPDVLHHTVKVYVAPDPLYLGGG